MLTVRGQKAFIFDTRTDVLVKVSKVFETENVSTWGRLEPPTLRDALDAVDISDDIHNEPLYNYCKFIVIRDLFPAGPMSVIFVL